MNPPTDLSRIIARIYRMPWGLLYIEQQEIRVGKTFYWIKTRIDAMEIEWK